MKLLTRYSLVTLIVMLGIFIASSAVLYRFTQIILIKEMDADLKGVKERVLTFVEKNHSFPTGYPLDEEKIFFTPSGNQPIGESSAVTTMFSQRENKMHNFMRLDFPLMVQNQWYKVTIAKPLEGMHHLSNALITISIGTIFIIIFIEMTLNGYLLRRLWRPFYKSLEIMREFRLGGSATLAFPATSISEFSFMNDSLQLATSKARQDYLVLKEFTENASHEMQTPLSIIRSKLDILIQEKELSENQSQLASEAYKSIKRLTTLNRSLLLLAKIDNHQYDNRQPLRLNEKVKEKIEQFRELWHNHEIAVVSHLEASNPLTIDPELLDILLNNLFSNAINHNIPHGYIGISLTPNQLKISNTGDAQPLDEQRLFTRFYKASINSNRNGLGLSIMKQIALASGLLIRYNFEDHKHAFTIAWQ